MNNVKTRKSYLETKRCGDCALYDPSCCHCDAGVCGITGNLVEENRDACMDYYAAMGDGYEEPNEDAVLWEQ